MEARRRLWAGGVQLNQPSRVAPKVSSAGSWINPELTLRQIAPLKLQKANPDVGPIFAVFRLRHLRAG